MEGRIKKQTTSCSVTRAPESTKTTAKQRATEPQRCCQRLGSEVSTSHHSGWICLQFNKAGSPLPAWILGGVSKSWRRGKTRKTCKVVFQSLPWHPSHWSPFQVILRSWYGAQKWCTKHSFIYSLLWEWENVTTNHKATTVVRWKQTLIFLWMLGCSCVSLSSYCHMSPAMWIQTSSAAALL